MILNLEGITEAAVVAKEETIQNKIKNKETLIELLNECLRSKPIAINVLDTYTYISDQTEIKLSTMIRLGDMSMFMDSEWRTCKKNSFYDTTNGCCISATAVSLFAGKRAFEKRKSEERQAEEKARQGCFGAAE